MGKICPALLAVMFLTNHDGLNKLGRGSPKEHFCHVRHF